MTTAAAPDERQGQVVQRRLGALLPALRTMAATTAVGLALGLLVGGVGSRLAMRALFLTSDPSVRGVISDDGFPIGRFDPMASLNLLLVGTLLGVIGAFVYLAVRPFLIGPPWFRWITCSLAAGAVVGSMLVHAEGVDFTLLGPHWFAIALFVALPALFGLLAPPAVEWAARSGGWFQTRPASVALMPLATFLFPPLLLLVGVPALVVMVVHRAAQGSPGLWRRMHHPMTMWTVRAGWFAVALVGLLALIRDAAAIL